MRLKCGLAGLVSTVIHCLSGSRPFAGYGATTSIGAPRFVDQSSAAVAPRLRIATVIASAGARGVGSLFLFGFVLWCPPLLLRKSLGRVCGGLVADEQARA